MYITDPPFIKIPHVFDNGKGGSEAGGGFTRGLLLIENPGTAYMKLFLVEGGLSLGLPVNLAGTEIFIGFQSTVV